MINFREPFQGVSGPQVYAFAEQTPGCHNLGHGRCQRQRARASDDQGCNRYHDGIARAGAEQQPGDQGQGRCGVNKGHIKRHGLVGDLAIAGPFLLARVQHFSDIGQQGIRRAAHSFAVKGLVEIDSARIKRLTALDQARQAFTGDEAFINGAGAARDLHIDHGAFASREQDLIAAAHVFGTNAFDLSIARETVDGPVLQGGQIVRGGMCLAPQTGIEKASNEQEEEQHHTGIEIGVIAVRRSFPNTDAKGQDQRQRDRHIHIGPAMFEHGPGGTEEMPTAEHQNRKGDQAGYCVQRGARITAHFTMPAPDRYREQHDIGERKGSHTHGDQQRTLFALCDLLRAVFGIGRDAVAEAGHSVHDRVGRGRPMPGDVQASNRQVHSDLFDPGQFAHRCLDLR